MKRPAITLALILLAVLAPDLVMADAPTCAPMQKLGTGTLAQCQTNWTGWACLWTCPDGKMPFIIGAWSEMDPDWLVKLATVSGDTGVATLYARLDTTSTPDQFAAQYPKVYPLVLALVKAATTPGSPQAIPPP